MMELGEDPWYPTGWVCACLEVGQRGDHGERALLNGVPGSGSLESSRGDVSVSKGGSERA